MIQSRVVIEETDGVVGVDGGSRRQPDQCSLSASTFVAAVREELFAIPEVQKSAEHCSSPARAAAVVPVNTGRPNQYAPRRRPELKEIGGRIC
jgi:hypothetical protein